MVVETRIEEPEETPVIELVSKSTCTTLDFAPMQKNPIPPSVVTPVLKPEVPWSPVSKSKGEFRAATVIRFAIIVSAFSILLFELIHGGDQMVDDSNRVIQWVEIDAKASFSISNYTWSERIETYQWFLNHTEIQGETSGAITIPQVNHTNTGRYQCIHRSFLKDTIIVDFDLAITGTFRHSPCTISPDRRRCRTSRSIRPFDAATSQTRHATDPLGSNVWHPATNISMAS